MNVLVTGGGGMIAMAVRPVLRRSGHAVTPVDITDFGRLDPDLILQSLDDAAGLDRLVRERRIDAIIHCAAISGPMMAKGDPMLVVSVNIDATAHLLDLARRHAMRRFVYCSSIGIYGDVGPGIITEDTPLHPTSVYGASKLAGEALVEGFAAEYGVSGVSLRIARVYGPYRRANCHLLNVIRDAETGVETTIPCDPAFPFHYTYADDVAEAILAALEAQTLPRRAFNVSGPSMTMLEIAQIARRALPGARIALAPGADDVPDRQEAFSVERIKRDLGWQPRFGLSKGLLSYREAIRSGRVA